MDDAFEKSLSCGPNVGHTMRGSTEDQLFGSQTCGVTAVAQHFGFLEFGQADFAPKLFEKVGSDPQKTEGTPGGTRVAKTDACGRGRFVSETTTQSGLCI